jgi:hypothetical protein
MPEKAIFTATAFDPKITHKKIEDKTAAKDSSGFVGCWSNILLLSQKSYMGKGKVHHSDDISKKIRKDKKKKRKKLSASGATRWRMFWPVLLICRGLIVGASIPAASAYQIKTYQITTPDLRPLFAIFNGDFTISMATAPSPCWMHASW